MIAITKESAAEGSEKKEQTPEQYFEEWLNIATDEQLVDLVRNPDAELPVKGIKRANAIGMATVMISNRQVMQLYQAIAQQQQMMMQPAQPAYGAGVYPPAAYGAMPMQSSVIPGAQAMYGDPTRGGVDPALMQGQPSVDPSLAQTGYSSVPGVPPDFDPSSN